MCVVFVLCLFVFTVGICMPGNGWALWDLTKKGFESDFLRQQELIGLGAAAADFCFALEVVAQSGCTRYPFGELQGDRECHL